MDSSEERNDIKKDYTSIKSEKMIYRIVGKAFAWAGLGCLIVSFVFLPIGFESYFQSNLFLLQLLFFVFLGLGGILSYIADKRTPLCIYRKQKTTYLYEENKYYCKNCNKYF